MFCKKVYLRRKRALWAVLADESMLYPDPKETACEVLSPSQHTLDLVVATTEEVSFILRNPIDDSQGL